MTSSIIGRGSASDRIQKDQKISESIEWKIEPNSGSNGKSR